MPESIFQPLLHSNYRAAIVTRLPTESWRLTVWFRYSAMPFDHIGYTWNNTLRVSLFHRENQVAEKEPVIERVASKSPMLRRFIELYHNAITHSRFDCYFPSPAGTLSGDAPCEIHPDAWLICFAHCRASICAGVRLQLHGLRLLACNLFTCRSATRQQPA